jgi:NAD(P)-dependent dehydrogenase (short-subunit alcohol dehydrogenase family)
MSFQNPHTSKHHGKDALITGGTSGLGLATAQRLAVEGAKVIVTGRRQAALEAAVEQIGHNATGIRGDISNPADLDRLYEHDQEASRTPGHPVRQRGGRRVQAPGRVSGLDH